MYLGPLVALIFSQCPPLVRACYTRDAWTERNKDKTPQEHLKNKKSSRSSPRCFQFNILFIQFNILDVAILLHSIFASLTVSIMGENRNIKSHHHKGIRYGKQGGTYVCMERTPAKKWVLKSGSSGFEFTSHSSIYNLCDIGQDSFPLRASIFFH